MAEKSAKKKPKKAAKDASVLGTLSATRPTRLGGERRGAAKPKAARPKKAKATKRAATRKARHVPQAPRVEAPPAGWQAPGDRDGQRDGGPVELVTTAVQAAGEIAQLGLAVGGQILRRAANRIPGR